MFDIYDLLGLMLITAALMWWWHVGGQKQKVLGFTRRYCKERGYQFLDETLGFARYTVIKDGRNRRFLCRTYRFDFSPDNVERCEGEVSINGNTIVRMMLQTELTEIEEFPAS